MNSYSAIFEKTGTGYGAAVPDLPGCVAAGATFEETRTLMQEAMALHLKGMREDGDPIPQPTTVVLEHSA